MNKKLICALVIAPLLVLQWGCHHYHTQVVYRCGNCGPSHGGPSHCPPPMNVGKGCANPWSEYHAPARQPGHSSSAPRHVESTPVPAPPRSVPTQNVPHVAPPNSDAPKEFVIEDESPEPPESPIPADEKDSPDEAEETDEPASPLPPNELPPVRRSRVTPAAGTIHLCGQSTSELISDTEREQTSASATPIDAEPEDAGLPPIVRVIDAQ